MSTRSQKETSSGKCIANFRLASYVYYYNAVYFLQHAIQWCIYTIIILAGGSPFRFLDNRPTSQTGSLGTCFAYRVRVIFFYRRKNIAAYVTPSVQRRRVNVEYAESNTTLNRCAADDRDYEEATLVKLEKSGVEKIVKFKKLSSFPWQVQRTLIETGITVFQNLLRASKLSPSFKDDPRNNSNVHIRRLPKLDDHNVTQWTSPRGSLAILELSIVSRSIEKSTRRNAR